MLGGAHSRLLREQSLPERGHRDGRHHSVPPIGEARPTWCDRALELAEPLGASSLSELGACLDEATVASYRNEVIARSTGSQQAAELANQAYEDMQAGDLATALAEVSQAIDTCLRVDSHEDDVGMLSYVSGVAAAFPPQDCARIWEQRRPDASLLRVFASGTRAWLLKRIVALQPLMRQIAGDDAVSETLGAVQDVARWWP